MVKEACKQCTDIPCATYEWKDSDIQDAYECTVNERIRTQNRRYGERDYKKEYICVGCGRSFKFPWLLGGHVSGKIDRWHGRNYFRKVCHKCPEYTGVIEQRTKDWEAYLNEVKAGKPMTVPYVFCPKYNNKCLKYLFESEHK
jgi:hypothetical protein